MAALRAAAKEFTRRAAIEARGPGCRRCLVGHGRSVADPACPRPALAGLGIRPQPKPPQGGEEIERV